MKSQTIHYQDYKNLIRSLSLQASTLNKTIPTSPPNRKAAQCCEQLIKLWKHFNASSKPKLYIHLTLSTLRSQHRNPLNFNVPHNVLTPFFHNVNQFNRHTNTMTHFQSSPQGPTLKEYVHNQISVVVHVMYINHEWSILVGPSPTSWLF
jgi:hypothetical protein